MSLLCFPPQVKIKDLKFIPAGIVINWRYDEWRLIEGDQWNISCPCLHMVSLVGAIPLAIANGIPLWTALLIRWLEIFSRPRSSSSPAISSLGAQKTDRFSWLSQWGHRGGQKLESCERQRNLLGTSSSAFLCRIGPGWSSCSFYRLTGTSYSSLTSHARIDPSRPHHREPVLLLRSMPLSELTAASVFASKKNASVPLEYRRTSFFLKSNKSIKIYLLNYSVIYKTFRCEKN